MNKVWKRKCPNCDKDLIYNSKRWYYTNQKYNKLCRGCTRKTRGLMASSRKGCHLTDEHKRRIGEVVALRHKIYGHPMLGKKHSPETIAKLKITNSGKNNGMYGKHHSIKTRRRLRDFRTGLPGPSISPEGLRTLRIKRINEISKAKYDGSQVMPSYNLNACEFFKKVNDQFKWNGQYATCRGEYHIKDLGYFVDYYEPQLNLVIEWDEKIHYDVNGRLRLKDKQREDEIKSYLKCTLLRIKENEFDEKENIKHIYEVITNR